MSVRVWTVLAIVFGVALAGLALIVRGGPLAIDTSIRTALDVGGPIPLPLDVLNSAGYPVVWDVAVALLAVVIGLGGGRREAFVLVAAVVAGELLSIGMKLLVDRERPPGLAVVDLVTQASFPSGHATRATITLAVLLLIWRGPRAWRTLAGFLAAGGALLMGVARILSGEHWPTDVLGAYLLAGIVIAGAAVVLGWPRRINPRGSCPRPGLADDPGGGQPPGSAPANDTEFDRHRSEVTRVRPRRQRPVRPDPR